MNTKKRNFIIRLLAFGKRFLLNLCEYPISLWYYKTLRMPLVNHLTIGTGKLGKQQTRFPHPVGMVIGQGVVIGRNCMIYQNVTIGLKDLHSKDYPVIGNDVVIYAGAIIVGNVHIGDGAIVGAGCIVTKDVPSNKIAVGSPMRIIDKRLTDSNSDS
ncbi:serine O-acetyltransferase [Cronobacter dublinensis]